MIALIYLGVSFKQLSLGTQDWKTYAHLVTGVSCFVIAIILVKIARLTNNFEKLAKEAESFDNEKRSRQLKESDPTGVRSTTVTQSNGVPVELRLGGSDEWKILSEDLWKLLARADFEFVPPLSKRESTIDSSFTATFENSFGSSKLDSTGEGRTGVAGNTEPGRSPVGPARYWQSLLDQEVIVALDGSRAIGFLSFRRDYVLPNGVRLSSARDVELATATTQNVPQTSGMSKTANSSCVYVSTVIVDPEYRGLGLTRLMYERLRDHLRESNSSHPIVTRTWNGNTAHLRVLEQLGFTEFDRLPNDRGPLIDTVYLVWFE